MLTTVETIRISKTTTSCRVQIGDVNFNETLDERYRRYFEAETGAAQEPSQPASAAGPAPAEQEAAEE
jgi:hypothetical protein